MNGFLFPIQLSIRFLSQVFIIGFLNWPAEISEQFFFRLDQICTHTHHHHTHTKSEILIQYIFCNILFMPLICLPFNSLLFLLCRWKARSSYCIIVRFRAKYSGGTVGNSFLPVLIILTSITNSIISILCISSPDFSIRFKSGKCDLFHFLHIFNRFNCILLSSKTSANELSKCFNIFIKLLLLSTSYIQEESSDSYLC